MNYPHPPGQLVYLLLGALRIADHRRTRPCRVSGFEVFATDEKQENNQQHVGFHCSPMNGGFRFIWNAFVRVGNVRRGVNSIQTLGYRLP